MRRHVRFLIGLLLGLLLSLWFLHTLHWEALRQALLGLDPLYLVASAAVLLLEFPLRSLRWRSLLQLDGGPPPYLPLLRATLVGGAVNTLLPARAGDLARPIVAQRQTGFPLAPLFATNIAERVLDLVGLLWVFLLMLATLPPGSGPEGELVENLRRYGWSLGGAGLAGLATLVLLARNPPARRWLARLLLPLPRGEGLSRLALAFLDGFSALAQQRALLPALLLSLAIWTNGVLSILLLFHSLGIQLPFGAACFTAVAIALTVALPQAPGFVGVFHVAMEKTLLLWGLQEGPAQGFAIAFWAVSYLPVTAIGLSLLWQEGLHLGELLSSPGEDLPPEAGQA